MCLQETRVLAGQTLAEAEAHLAPRWKTAMQACIILVNSSFASSRLPNFSFATLMCSFSNSCLRAMSVSISSPPFGNRDIMDCSVFASSFVR